MKETIAKDPDFFSTVDYHEAADLDGAQCCLGSGSDERGTGYFGSVVKRDGDITGVFNGDGYNGGREAMIAAIRSGGNRLDAYAIDNSTGEPGRLARTYAKLGFEPVARVPFNAEYAAPGVKPQDIVFYKHNGDSADKVAANYGKYPPPTKSQYDALPVMDYDSAIEFRDNQIKNKR
ncbi:hypothetical protein FACS1894184_16940 [Clostridia bacterium]|nr:hypothetical protein FACS1894184_16940 [Clostridia bacterium]